MISEELKAIVDKLKEQGKETESKMNFFEAATEEQVSEFETNNSLAFPSKFREWLLFSDGGECFLPAGVQFYGVAHKPLIDVNDVSRPDDSYVVIGALSEGDPILIKKDADKDSFGTLVPLDLKQLEEEIAPLVLPYDDEINAIRFDALMYAIELGYVAGQKYTRGIKELIGKAKAVSKVVLCQP